MKPRRLLLLAVLLLAGLAAALAIYARSHGFSARPEPSGAEAFIARRVRSFAIPPNARQASNPVRLNPEVLSEAMKHFADHCATCHGNDGSGNTSIGKGLYPRPPDMRKAETQTLTDGEIYWVIHNGVRFTGMPAFGEDKPGVADEDSWKLVHFIRHLPNISEEELQVMKKLNPKNAADLEEEELIRRFLAGEDIPPGATHGH
jgi:mono/diheme cytochrome c family protein